MIGARPHHDGSPLYVSDDAPSIGSVVQVRVRIPAEFGAVKSVTVRSDPDHEPRWSNGAHLGVRDGWSWWEADVLMSNPQIGYRFLIVRADGSHEWLDAMGSHVGESSDADDFRLVAYPAPPAWGRSSVMYQIFPDRFARSDRAASRHTPPWAVLANWDDEPIHSGPDTGAQLYGGDLDGVIDHLDHLERLGVDLIYLTPFFPARSNHRYDAWSFDHVDELLGGDAALQRLVTAAHERGFRVLGDLTTNHTGDSHEWFTSSRGRPDAPESEFYYWLDDEQTNYVSWLGVQSLPKLDWKSRELRGRVIEGSESVVAKWLAEPYGLDGWRIDVANMTGRHGADDLNADVRRTLRRTMIEVNPDTLLLAESTNDTAEDFQGDGWHGQMTYASFTRPIWGWLAHRPETPWFFGIPYAGIPAVDGHGVHEANVRFTAHVPWRVRLHTMNALDTHDTARFAGFAHVDTLPTAVGLSMTLPGIPVVFAGDEFALTGDDGEHARRPIPWGRVVDAASTIDMYTSLIALRRSHIALNDGGMRWLHVESDALAFIREHADESVLVIATRAAVTFDLAVEGTALVGDITIEAGRVRTDGPAFGAWQLPGVQHP
ncbi:MAG TPA: glycoside hydrolase family 13 protein [Naasia sp.]